MRTRSAVVSLIGRPNVGKSTIFNRLLRQNFKAMTFDQPGVTRDRHYDICTLENKEGNDYRDVILVDTGGFYPEKVEEDKSKQKAPAEPFFDIMADHAKLAIDESDLILFVVDVREGLIPFDKTILDYIRTTHKPCWLLINKFDTDKQWGTEADFYTLGFNEKDFHILSAEHNRGLVTLKEKLFDFTLEVEKKLKTESETLEMQKGIKPNFDVVGSLAIIGSPNAGKSTLLNRLIGAKRALVSDVAGTTVDPIEGYFDIFIGEKALELGRVENKFRKHNTELLREYVDFEKEFEREELIAYESAPDEIKNLNDDLEDDFNEEELSDLTDEELIELEAQAQSIEDDLSDDEEEDEEKSVEPESNESDDSGYRSLKIIDTAGIRKQKQVKGFIEEQSVFRALKSISESDIVIYMVDATKGITHQDRRLCDIALEKGKSIIICLNKVDLLNNILRDRKKKKEWLLDLRAKIPWLSYCELIPISALKGSYLSHLKRSIVSTLVIRSHRVSTSSLNKALSSLVDRYPIVLNKAQGTRFKVKYASMIKASPPTFILFTNKSKGIPVTYRRYLTNGLRREFDIINTPVHLIFRTTTDIERRLRGKRS